MVPGSKEIEIIYSPNDIHDYLIEMPVKDLVQWFDQLHLDAHDQQIAKRVLIEIRHRLDTLLDVGLGYLTLDRLANSLSGGESQRLKLAAHLAEFVVPASAG